MAEKDINSGLKFDRKEKTVDMCQAVADMRKEERQEGIREGIREGKQEANRKTARNMLKRGYSLETVAEVLELPEGLIEDLVGGEE